MNRLETTPGAPRSAARWHWVLLVVAAVGVVGLVGVGALASTLLGMLQTAGENLRIVIDGAEWHPGLLHEGQALGIAVVLALGVVALVVLALAVPLMVAACVAIALLAVLAVAALVLSPLLAIGLLLWWALRPRRTPPAA